MGYHLVDPADLEQWDDRPTDVRSLSAAAGYDYHDSKIGMRVYDLAPGEQPGLQYHYHDEQVEVFYVLEGELHVETPDREYAVESGQFFVAEPESPHRAFNPASSEETAVVVAVGAPPVSDGHAYDP